MAKCSALWFRHSCRNPISSHLMEQRTCKIQLLQKWRTLALEGSIVSSSEATASLTYCKSMYKSISNSCTSSSVLPCKLRWSCIFPSSLDMSFVAKHNQIDGIAVALDQWWIPSRVGGSYLFGMVGLVKRRKRRNGKRRIWCRNIEFHSRQELNVHEVVFHFDKTGLTYLTHVVSPGLKERCLELPISPAFPQTTRLRCDLFRILAMTTASDRSFGHHLQKY